MNGPRLRSTFPFRRVAVVLSGGGALGAYQVGILRVLNRIGLHPPIVAGLSVGAINAVAWVSLGFDTVELERTWSKISPSSIGMRWTTLTLRVFGLFLAVLAAFEFVLTLLGSDELSVARLFLKTAAVQTGAPTAVFEALAWVLLGAVGYGLARMSRRADDWLSGRPASNDPRLWQRLFGIFLLLIAVVHVTTWTFGWFWPHRFSATLLVLGTLLWLSNRPGGGGEWLRGLLVRVSPESGGRGLWRGLARRNLLEGLVRQGQPARLVDGTVHLLVNAVAVDSGRMCYFINWSHPTPEFRRAIERSLGEIVRVTTPAEVMEASSASSAIPVLFQPVRLKGRDFVDAGMFSSQALHAVIADGADAVLVVMMSPSMCPSMPNETPHLFEVGARLLELGNWRDLRTELLSLPPPWSRDGDPATLCVVEPDCTLPGHMYRFDPADARELMRRGERDAWAALERAGWLETAHEEAAGAAPRAS